MEYLQRLSRIGVSPRERFLSSFSGFVSPMSQIVVLSVVLPYVDDIFFAVESILDADGHCGGIAYGSDVMTARH